MSNAESAVGALNAVDLTLALTASDMEASIRFYTDGLGFEIEEKHESDGVLQFVSLRAGKATLGLGRDDFAKGRDRVKGAGLRIWITTDQDLQTLADRAKAAGITLDSEPEELPWGGTAFMVTDPDGFKMSIASAS